MTVDDPITTVDATTAPKPFDLGEPHTSDSAIEQFLEVALVNAARHRELNLGDSPQTLLLTLTNRSPLHQRIERDAQLVLRFRPGTIRRPENVLMAPELRDVWALAHWVGADATEIRMQSLSSVEVEPGATHTIRLLAIAGEPAGGTRVTRVEMEYLGFTAEGRPLAGRHLLHMSVRRNRIAAPDLTGIVGAGSVAVAGPFTAGFMGGAAALNTGDALTTLNVRIANSSGRPVRLVSGGDDATRIVIGHRTGTRHAPWGLLGGHGDHLAIVKEPPGWMIERYSLRHVGTEVWMPDDPLNLEFELHTTAEPCNAQLVIRIENLADHDDVDIVLLVTIGPLAVGNGQTRSVRPIQIWGADGSLDFFASRPTRSGQEADEAPKANAQVKAVAGGGLRITGPAAPEATVVEVAGSLAMTGRPHEPRENAPAQLEIRTPARRLMFGVGKEHAWIGTDPGGRALRIDPAGEGLSIGDVTPEPQEVVVRGPLTIQGRGRGEGTLLRLARDPGADSPDVRIRAGVDDRVGVESNRTIAFRGPVHFGQGIEVGHGIPVAITSVGGFVEVTTSDGRGRESVLYFKDTVHVDRENLRFWSGGLLYELPVSALRQVGTNA